MTMAHSRRETGAAVREKAGHSKLTSAWKYLQWVLSLHFFNQAHFFKDARVWKGGVGRTPQTWPLITTAAVSAYPQDAGEGARAEDTVLGTSESA